MPRSASTGTDQATSPFLFFLKSHERPRGDQIVSGDKIFFTEKMLERGNPRRHLRQHEIALLAQLFQAATETALPSLAFSVAGGFFFTRLRASSFFMVPSLSE